MSTVAANNISNYAETFTIATEKIASKDEVIGVDQSWQAAELTDTGAAFLDGTPSYRVKGQNYFNLTGKLMPIRIVSTQGASSTGLTLSVNGEVVDRAVDGNNTTQAQSVSYLLEPDDSYSLGGSSTVESWREFRPNS